MPAKSGYMTKRQAARLPQQAVVIVKKITGQLDHWDEGYINGVDTDFYAGPFNFDTLKLQGGAFTIIRAGEGSAEDPQFYQSWPNAEVSGVKRGAYWYLTHFYSYRQQAQTLARLLKDDPGEIAPTIDFEDDRSQGRGKNVEHLNFGDMQGFNNVLHELIPAWPWKTDTITYSNWSFLTTWIRGGDIDPWIKAHPLWYANPAPTSTKYNPKTPWNWKPSIIQTSFIGDGPFYGNQKDKTGYTAKDIDLDTFIGSRTDFEAFCL